MSSSRSRRSTRSRSRSRSPRTKQEPSRAVWQRFQDASTLDQVMSAARAVLASVDADGSQILGHEVYAAVRNAYQPVVAFKQKRFFELVDNVVKQFAVEREQVIAAGSPDDKAVLVAGAGPVGLWTAFHARLVGMHPVTVVEKRREFSRANIIHLMAPLVQRLAELGASQLIGFSRLPLDSYPHVHIGTRRLQLFLMKMSLLFGVQVMVGRHITALDESVTPARAFINRYERQDRADALAFKASDSDDDRLKKKGRDNINLEEQTSRDPTFFVSGADAAKAASTAQAVIPFTNLVIAEGERSTTQRRLGVVKMVDRFAPALGMIINMEIVPGQPLPTQSNESLTSPGSVTGLMQRLSDHGVLVENLEYLRDETHYLVITIRSDAPFLKESSVFKEKKNTLREALQPENIDQDKLRQLAVDIAKIGHNLDAPLCKHNGVQLFDFSARSRVITPFVRLGKHCVAYPTGDALIEPFWPQGLGVNRGFPGAMDTVWSMVRHVTVSVEDATAERTASYAAMRAYPFSLGVTLPGVFSAADPIKRYAGRCFLDVKQEYMTERIRKAGLKR